jgi:hypothetical protein
MSRSYPSGEALAIKSDEKTIFSSSSRATDTSRYDPLADMVVRRWWDATQWMRSDVIAGYSIEETLFMCDRQRRGVYDPQDAPLLGGIDIFIPLTDMKCMAAEAWLRDMLGNVVEMPWIVEPTPIPDLPSRMKQKILRDLKMEIVNASTQGNALAAAQAFGAMPGQAQDVLFGEMIARFPGDLEKTARELKEAQRKLAYSEAAKAAKGMERLMRDECVEMDFLQTMYQLFYDLVTFPAAIVKGPILTNKPRIYWKGNSRVVEKRDRLNAYRVAPFDFKPSPDSSNTQNGTYVIEKQRMTRRSLTWALGQKYWIDSQVKALLHEYQTRNRNWLIDDLNGNPEVQANVQLWREDETIEAIEHHGICSGRELRPYGISADDDTYYETKVVVSGYRTLMCKVMEEPYVSQRPFHNASYERHGERFWNTCPVIKLRDVQRSLNAATRAQIRNMAFSSGPQVEIDVQRVKGYVANLEDLLDISPYRARLVDPDMVNGGRPAYTFTNVPEIISKLIPVLQYYWKVADDVSNIPNYAQGDTGLSGAGRTFRGFSAVFAQALKVFKMPVQNLDTGIFVPFAQALYDYNMTYSEDDSIKGDANVRALGSSGIVERELAQQRALESMQVVSQMSPAVAEIAPDKARKVLEWVWAKALEGLGVPIEQFAINPDVQATITEEIDAGPQTPIPAIGQTPSPG